MATGGERFSDSVIQSSEVTSSDKVYKFACSPCNEIGNSSEAFFKCLNCQNFLCIKCYDGHNQFVKKHHIVNVNTKETGSRIIQMKGHTCEAHQEKLIEMYCKDHDEVFCSACTLKHRSCGGVDYIPDIAGSLLQGKLKNEVKQDLENISTELLKTKSSCQNILSKMNTDKYKTINEMKQCKVRLLKRIEEWEQSSLLNVEEKYQGINTNVTSDLQNINHMLHDVEKQLSKMREGKYDDDIDEVVTLKVSERQVKAVRPRISEYVWKPLQHVVFQPNYWIEYQKNIGDLSGKMLCFAVKLDIW
ncbi:uncharacterized protein LOC132734537 [Ruditapes philippinarum]|uniref:uncharacterized protein LOC132734537 n=1 Tax=Ruditapes philippinarum TaxID=129788 RepID=UPI00295B387A|nr:uncharacterized protein LOC132734537 [Ruditapes philippinarum]